MKIYSPSLETGTHQHHTEISGFLSRAEKLQTLDGQVVEGQDPQVAGEDATLEPSCRRKVCQHRCPLLSAGKLPPQPPSGGFKLWAVPTEPYTYCVFLPIHIHLW